ncbi:MAG: phosphoethanolamine--lipid A transferase [Burkholderiaceae bacterium]
MDRRAVQRNPLTLAALTGAWIALLPNGALWLALLALPETHSPRGALFVAGFALIVAAATTGLLSLFAWSRSIRPAATLFLVAAALGAYFMFSYGIVIDPTMMVNVLHTDPAETRDLLNWRLFAALVLLAGLPLWVVWKMPLERLRAPAQALRNLAGLVGSLVLVVGVVLALFADFSSTMREHKTLRYLINPLNSFYALGVLAADSAAQPKGPPQAIGADARALPAGPGAKPPLLLLVVGETARAANFSLNGYARATNPELAATDAISFGAVTSCGTSTAASLPCMFSDLGRVEFGARKGERENLLDLVQRAGLAVLWIDNQSGCKGLCARVPSADAHDAAPGAPPLPPGLCEGGECYDEALLHGLDQRLAALAPQQRARGVLIVLHPIGSHGPAYYKRSPPQRKPFLPECTTNVLRECEPHTLVNAYDNSIAYADHVLAQSLVWARAQSARYEATLLYISDHGESLGENGLYLHGVPFSMAPSEQTQVPMIAWLAPGSPTRADCLRELRGAPLSHDNLFHTALGLLRVQAGEYRASLDAFAVCR